MRKLSFPKRPCKILVLAQGVAVIGVKSGDVYLIPDIATREAKHYADEDETLILGHTSMLTDVAVEGKVIITADRDGFVRKSRYPEAYQIEGYFLGHRAAVTAIAFARSKYVLSGSLDGTVRLWDLASCKELVRCAPRTEWFTDAHRAQAHASHVGFRNQRISSEKLDAAEVLAIGSIRDSSGAAGARFAVAFSGVSAVFFVSVTDAGTLALDRVVELSSAPLALATSHADVLIVTSSPWLQRLDSKDGSLHILVDSIGTKAQFQIKMKTIFQ